MTQPQSDPADPADGAPAKQHGDPLLASAQERNDGDDGSRHGHGTTQAAGDDEQD